MTPAFRTIETNGVTLRAAVQGSGPLVVMVHGFPESWYSWRHQIGPLASAGFTACALDVRGYGGSDKPHAIEAYDLETLARDIAGVIDALSPGAPAVLIGHDWGAPIVWTTALAHADKVRAAAGLSVPHVGVGARPFLEVADMLFTKRGLFFYQIYFQEEGVAEAELESDVRASVRKMLYAWSGDGVWPKGKKAGANLFDDIDDFETLPAWLTPADIDYFTAEFESSGFRGPLNRYRNNARDHAYLTQFAERKIEQPTLFIGGDKDPVLTSFPGVDLVGLMRDKVTDLRAAHILPGIGHWTQQEAPDLVTGHLIDWLATL
ncbi:MAG: alpha/beta hydrolase [Terricaulis sp.]